MPLQKPPFFSWVVLKQLCIDTGSFLHVATLSLMPFNLGAAVFCTAVQTCCRDYSINFLVYLFIYLFINFTKRPGSLTEQPPLQVPEGKKRRKLVIQLTRMTILRNEECQCKNRIWEDIDKKSTTHTIELAVQWLTSVALNTHTSKNINVHHRKGYESYWKDHLRKMLSNWSLSKCS